MGESMIKICTICARGGSKGVPGKNKRMLCGKPLLAWTVELAKNSNLFDLVAFSSDSSELLLAAKQAGADLLVERPREMASDVAGKIPAIQHCLEQAELALGQKAAVFVDLDVTSPLRSVEDVVGAVNLLETTKVSSVITGCTSRRSPYFNLVELNSDGSVKLSKEHETSILRRQDSPQCFDMNASIYVWNRDQFMRDPKTLYADTRLFEMPEKRSIDIDSEVDFELVQLLMKAQRKEETHGG
jgi:N-acylneuraminate cytidylyltransferase/CMP-N,N'-diacetyllegionaminic acid synthase